MYKSLFLGIIALIPTLVSAQSPDYFQQQTDYKIEVQLDDKKHELTGFETIEYTNNSPNALDFIWIHLWPNAYKDDHSALAKQQLENGTTYFHYLKDKDRGYIDGIAFQVNGQAARWEFDKENKDICRVFLPEPLQRKQKITLTIPFHVKVPDGEISRMGHVDQSYFITQWYPKPAVYDNQGWHQMPYLDQGEFYSEFGSFDVKITLPKNYVVGSTGDLVNGDAEYAWLTKKSEEATAKTDFGKDMTFPASDTAFKTLHFKQTNVHDFAWFADKRWNVLKSEVELPGNKKKVTTWAFFTNKNAKYWKKAPQYLNDATWFYSKHCGDYPYNHVTAVDGTISAGSGMEYPNITVIGDEKSDYSLETVIMHEVGHNWFYGILGSNEREHGWMDEGLNSFFESRYNEWKHPDANFFNLVAGRGGRMEMAGKVLGANKHKQNYYYELSYLYMGRKGEDQPIETHSAEFARVNYGAIMYSKTADVFNYLMSYLGEEKTDEIFHTYFDRWKFRHPYPEDLKKVAEEISGQSLAWLFDDLINTNKRLDYKISKVKEDKDRTMFRVKNLGTATGPLSISAIKDGKVVKTDWHGGFLKSKEFSIDGKGYDKLVIDEDRRTTDLYRKNNQSRTKGIFKTWEKLQFKFIGGLEDPTRTQIFWSPIVGWNNYNKTMVGVAFYNALIPSRRFEYIVAPMYGTGNNDLAGHAEFYYNMYPRLSFFQKLRVGVEASRYGWKTEFGGLNYNVITPSLTWVIKKANKRSSLEQSFTFRTVIVNKEVAANNETFQTYSLKSFNYYINDYTHTIRNARKINPFSLIFNVQQGKGFAKASVEGKYQLTFKGKNKGFDVRLFYGKAFIYDVGIQGDYRFRLSGQTGGQDYMYNQTFLGRYESPNNSFLGNQFTETDGAFKVYSPLGQSQNWVMTANFKTSLHRLFPFKLYADFGTYYNARNAFPTSKSLVYNWGVSLPILNNVCEIYFPIMYSSDIKNYLDINNVKWYERIRFTLNLKSLNPVKAIRAVKF